MPKKGHTEEQIVGALRQYESGEKVADICRKLGVSQASFYTWKKQYAGMGVQELRELRQLRDENGDLNDSWRICRWTGRFCRRSYQKSCKAAAAMPVGAVDPGTYQIGARRAARLLQVSRSTLLYKSRKPTQEHLGGAGCERSLPRTCATVTAA